MTQMARRTVSSAVLLAVVAVGVVLAFLPITAERGEPRQIHIVLRSMAFYVDAETAPNPPIRVRPGESITLVVRNDDAGITHDFAVHAWGVSTERLPGGASARLAFTVPDEARSTEYVCNPHSEMMRGIVVVD